jgi:hypothetical protein
MAKFGSTFLFSITHSRWLDELAKSLEASRAAVLYFPAALKSLEKNDKNFSKFPSSSDFIEVYKYFAGKGCRIYIHFYEVRGGRKLAKIFIILFKGFQCGGEIQNCSS